MQDVWLIICKKKKYQPTGYFTLRARRIKICIHGGDFNARDFPRLLAALPPIANNTIVVGLERRSAPRLCRSSFDLLRRHRSCPWIGVPMCYMYIYVQFYCGYALKIVLFHAFILSVFSSCMNTPLYIVYAHRPRESRVSPRLYAEELKFNRPNASNRRRSNDPAQH